MAEIIIFSSVSLIFLLILVQKFSLRLLYKNGFSAELDYSFFSLVLSGFKEQKKLGKMNPKIILPAKRALEFLFSHSEVTISDLRIGTNEDDPKKFGVRYRNVFSLFSALLVYLSKKTKKLYKNENFRLVFAGCLW